MIFTYHPASLQENLSLTKSLKNKRLKFAKDHRHWATEDWSKVLFSDESSIQQFVVRKYNVRRPIGKRFNPKYTVATMKHPLAK